VYPLIHVTDGLDEYVEGLPPVLFALLGETDLFSVEGFLNAELFNFLVPFVIVSCAVGVGVELVSGAIERGAMELLLAGPVGRGRVILEAALAIAVVSALLAGAVFCALTLGGQRVEVPLPLGRVAAASADAGLIGVTFGSLALLVGTLAPRRARCLAITAALVTAAFFLATVASVAPTFEGPAQLSPFFHYRAGDPLRNGMSWRSTGALGATSAALIGLAALVFQRKDLAC
jgi:ABC-2 type transport system permease protein